MEGQIRQRRNERRTLGAVMAETALVLPLVVVMIVLIIFLGWNFTRLAQATGMERYAVWHAATPGAPGPGIQGLDGREMRNPQLSHAFFGLNSDEANTLDETRNGTRYIIESYQDLRDQQADETYAYYDKFLNTHPAALFHRFEMTHDQVSGKLAQLGFSDTIRNTPGHSRLVGDWRYLNGLGYNSAKRRWQPNDPRVSPGNALRDVFFVDLDDGLAPYAAGGNELAKTLRTFYLDYPGYIGPVVQDTPWRWGPPYGWGVGE